jgi:hypothetical protein
MGKGAAWIGLVLVVVVLGGACGSSSPATTKDGGQVDRPATGTVSEGCMYVLGVSSCQTYTGTQSEVTGQINACEKVYAGTAVASCPTAGVLGTCVGISTGSLNETTEIFYYENDAGTLSLADLCDSAGGTLAPRG